MARRYKVRFPDKEAYKNAQSVAMAAGVHQRKVYLEFGQSLLQVQNENRLYISIEPSVHGVEAVERKFDMQLESLHSHFGAEIVEDFRYDLETDVFDPIFIGPDDPNNPSLDDVLDAIDAPSAWAKSMGEGVAIAVVDTGIDGSRAEFPASKRVGHWEPLNAAPWTDQHGHGTMCATIAAATKSEGGLFNGVAPKASVICCKTGFYDSELAAIYDYLLELAQTTNIRIIATNSFGIQTGSPPVPPEGSDFIPALDDALEAGITVVFSAGNYHEDAGGQPTDCGPNSIWLHKGRADVITVATCDMELNMWYYSSRGPGQYFGDQNTNPKPDVTAPTPRGGRILYGSSIRSLANGWGTSGACPQVAGLAALLLGEKPDLSNGDLSKAILSGANSLPHNPTCSGAGLINCVRSIDMI